MLDKTVNRQRFALNLGLIVMAFHIILSILLWSVIDFFQSEVAVREIAAPVTAGYAVSVLKYYLDTGGVVTSHEVVGMRLVLMVSTLVLFFFISLSVAPYIYLNDPAWSATALNNFYMAIEAGFGALMALIFSYLYRTE